MQCVAPLFQEALRLPSRVARHLLHPYLVRAPRNPGQAHSAALQMNKEQDVVGHQPAPAEHFDREEIDAGQQP